MTNQTKKAALQSELNDCAERWEAHRQYLASLTPFDSEYWVALEKREQFNAEYREISERIIAHRDT